MICSVCQKEWTGAPDDTQCPFCGADFRKGAAQHDIPGVIAFLIRKEGADVLLEPNKVNSFIADLVLGHDRDKKLLRVGSSNGIFEKAHAVLVEPKQTRREVMVLDMKQHLMENAFLSEENAIALVNMVLEGIGLPSLQLKSVEKRAEGAVPQQQPKPAPKTEPKSVPKSVPAEGAGKAAPDGSKGKTAPTRDGGKKPFRLQSISTFEYDGSSFAARKIQGPLFLKSEARMIGILVTYDPAPRSMQVSLDWQIFRQDGTPMTGMIHGVGTVSKGDTDYYQGWGWAVPGNWAVGRYTVRASMNGSNTLTAYFDVVEGRYDNPRLTMNEVRLFSAGAIPPDPADRKYAVTFSSHHARRIYFEISLLKMNVPVYTTLNYKIIKPNGEIFANYAVPIRFHKGDDKCWTGFGWDDPGHWQKGRYGYEVSIGDVNNIFCGVFDIV